MNIPELSRFTPKFTPMYKEKSLSPEEKEQLADEQKRLKEEEERRRQTEKQNELDMLKRNLEASNKQAEAMEEGFEAYSKCLTIAMRITKGDIVPLKDMKYLMEHEPELYKQATLLRQPNNDPKKWKSVLEDEEETPESTEETPESELEAPPQTQTTEDVRT